MLLDDDQQISDLVDMPTLLLIGKRRQVNAAEVGKIIKLWQQGSGIITAYLEKVQAMPGQGSSSMFGFGVSYGIIQGVIGALGIPVVLLHRKRGRSGRD